MRENTAFEKGIELSFDKLRQGGAALGFDLRQETLDVFLDQPIQDGLFGTPLLIPYQSLVNEILAGEMRKASLSILRPEPLA